MKDNSILSFSSKKYELIKYIMSGADILNLYKSLENANIITKKNIDKVEIVLVAHVLNPRGHDSLIQKNCSETEHFTVQEFNEIYQGIVGAGFFIKKTFFTEFEFLKDVISSYSEYSSTIVFNLCRNGKGMNKKTLIPSICDILDIRYTSSGAGQCALARNKSLFTSILTANGISCPVSGIRIEDLAANLTETSLIICKPINESASQGIDENSIIKLKEAKKTENNNYFMQQYIEGYECEVPIFSSGNQCFAMPPVGISFNNDKSTGIISYETSLNNNYGFYNLSDVLSEATCKKIMYDAEKTFRLLEMEKYGRVDFRIDSSTNQHFVIDISTTPYLTEHSSFAFSMSQSKCSYSDIYKLIFAATMEQNSN